MEYLKANGTEIPAQVCGKQIDRDWDGRASRTVTLTWRMRRLRSCLWTD